jgi:hypothetical protein
LSKNVSYSCLTKERGRRREVAGVMGSMWMPWIRAGEEEKYAGRGRGD